MVLVFSLVYLHISLYGKHTVSPKIIFSDLTYKVNTDDVSGAES